MDTTEIDGERYVLATDLAAERGVTLPTIHKAIKDGRLTGVARFGRMFVPESVALAWSPAGHGGGNRGGGRKKKAAE